MGFQGRKNYLPNTMDKTGRNDPCPCGSGKKYKKCHLADDERAAADARKAANKPQDNPPFIADAEDDELFGYDRAVDEIDTELDELLHEVDFPDMLRSLSAFIPHAELEGAYYAQGFFERVWIAAETLEDRDAYRGLLNRLGRENPELFAEIGGQLIWDILKQTVTDGRQGSLEPLFIAFAALASRDLLLFMSLADGMAYFGFLDSLVKGMRTGWPYVRDSKHLSPASKERFARRAINYEVFSAVEASIRIDAAGLGARIRNFEAWEDWEIEKCFELMSSNQSEELRKEHFSASSGEIRRNPELQAAFLDKLNSLTHVFRGFLRKEMEVPWTQADLASGEILDLLSREWDDPFMEGQDEDQGEDEDEGEESADENENLIRNLCPDSDILNDYFFEKFYEMDMQDFRACALWANLSYWLEMLVRLGLLDHAAGRDIWTSWQPALEAVNGKFKDMPAPPSAAQLTPPG